MKKFALLLLVLCAALVPCGIFAVPGWAATYYVDAKAGDDSKDGTSETAPLKTIQAALGKATEDGTKGLQTDTTVVLLSDIETTSTVQIAYLNTHTLIINGNGHTLRGSGKGNGSVISVLETGGLTINDLTITGGNAEEGGGGISIAGANVDLTVTNCVFTGNHAEGTTELDGGGAIYSSGGTLTVENCTFTGNTTGVFGGAIWVGAAESASITNCTFYDKIQGLSCAHPNVGSVL